MRGISLSKVYESSFAIFLATLLVSLRWDSLAVSLGLAVGTGFALAMLASWQVAVQQVFARPADPHGAPDAGSPASARILSGKALLAIALLKLPVLGAIVYVLVGRGWVDPISFVVGLGIPQVAVTLLAIGGALQRGGAPEPGGALKPGAPQAAR